MYPKKSAKSSKTSKSSAAAGSTTSTQLDAALHQAGSKLASATSSNIPAPTPGSVDVIASSSSSVGDSGIATPVHASTTDGKNVTPLQDLEEAKRAALRQRPARTDGGVVACLAVWEYCFKIGRVTVPPVRFITSCPLSASP
jgi:hypothetical protein